MKMRPPRHMFVNLITSATALIAIGYVINLVYVTMHAQTGRDDWIKDIA